MPIWSDWLSHHLIHGEQNECFLPASTEITMSDLAKANGSKLYQRHVIPGYGHIDCIYGKNAARMCIRSCWNIGATQ